MAHLTDDQKMLQETAAAFMADEGAIAKQLRHWRDIQCKDGFGHGLWKQFAELGLTGIFIPEEHGGLGLGATESALVLEEIGRNLTPSPFLATLCWRSPWTRAAGTRRKRSHFRRGDRATASC